MAPVNSDEPIGEKGRSPSSLPASLSYRPAEVVRREAKAVTDGSSTVTLDVSGQVSSPAPSQPELLAAAQRRWSEIGAASRTAASHRIDAPIRDALRALGYAEPGEDWRR